MYLWPHSTLKSQQAMVGSDNNLGDGRRYMHRTWRQRASIWREYCADEKIFNIHWHIFGTNLQQVHDGDDRFELKQVIEGLDIIVCHPQQGADEVAFSTVLSSRMKSLAQCCLVG